jgi:uncharacterized protein
MTPKLSEKYGPWALIAGASQGLGAAYTRQIAAAGINLVLVARREEALSALADEIRQAYQVQVLPLALDLALHETPAQILQAAAGLEVGLLVYNAGYSAVGPFLERELADHLREIDTNVRTPMTLAHGFAQRMLERSRGGIVLMSSLTAYQGSAFVSNYGATKAYNMILGEGLWEEWRDHGVDMLACAAGATRTPNYLASQPKALATVSTSTLSPEEVVKETLAALGKQPYVIPGGFNRLASFFMRRLLPRQLAIRMMGRILRGMYGY